MDRLVGRGFDGIRRGCFCLGRGALPAPYCVKLVEGEGHHGGAGFQKRPPSSCLCTRTSVQNAAVIDLGQRLCTVVSCCCTEMLSAETAWSCLRRFSRRMPDKLQEHVPEDACGGVPLLPAYSKSRVLSLMSNASVVGRSIKHFRRCGSARARKDRQPPPRTFRHFLSIEGGLGSSFCQVLGAGGPGLRAKQKKAAVPCVKPRYGPDAEEPTASAAVYASR